MLCLALDASGPAASSAVVRDGAVICERLLMLPKAHAAHLAPMARDALEAAGTAAHELDVVACVVGPGSFTGVRIGVALAQGIALAAGKPCCPVDALEALAHPYRAVDVTVCAMLDARAGQVYGAAFRRGERLMEDTAAPLEDFCRTVRAFGGPYLLIGDGTGAHGEAACDLLGEGARWDASALLRASGAAILALEREEAWLHPAALRPLYLRAPQAERERMARDAKG